MTIMSNIFNQNQVKSSVREYFEKKEQKESNNLLDEVRSKVNPVPPAESTVEYNTLYEALREARVPVFIPRELLALKDCDMGEVASHHLLAVFPNVKLLHLSLGPEGFIPKYTPNHKSIDRNPKLLNAITYHTAEFIRMNPEHSEQYLDLLFEAVHMYNQVVYSSGTISGQVGRITLGIEVARGKKNFHKDKTLKEMGLTITQVADMLRRTLPIDDTDPKFALTDVMSRYVYTQEEQQLLGTSSDIPPIAMASTAGLPWLGRQKGQCAVEAIIEADTFLKQVSGLLKTNIFNRQKGSYADVVSRDPVAAKDFIREVTTLIGRDYWYLTCGLLIPKAERYEAAKISEKSRNVWSAPFVTHLIGNQISYPVMERALNALTSSVETPSLAKFAATQGGMARLVDLIMDADKVIDFIYADNAYVYYPDGDEWYSIDLRSGEANATRDIGIAAGNYLLTEGWTTMDGLPLFSDTWAFMALVFFPLATIESLSLLGNLQIRNPGQGSGNAWTFIINHVMTTILLHFWTKMGKPKFTADVIEKLQSTTGIDFKVELHSVGFRAQLQEARDSGRPTSDTTSPRVVVKADILGWDITYTEFGATPVLNKERLLKSFVAPHPVGSSFVSPAAKTAHGYIQNFALLTVGAWAYPTLRNTIEEYVMNYWDALQKLITDGATTTEIATDELRQALDVSGYNEVLSLLNPQKALHTQDWATILFAPVDKPVRQPRKPTSILNRLTLLNLSGNEKSRYLERIKANGTLFGDKGFDKLSRFLEMLSPEELEQQKDFHRLGKKAFKDAWQPALVNDTKQLLDRDKYTKQQIRDTWDQLLLGKIQPIDLLMPEAKPDEAGKGQTVSNLPLAQLHPGKVFVDTATADLYQNLVARDTTLVTNVMFQLVTGKDTAVPGATPDEDDLDDAGYDALAKEYNHNAYHRIQMQRLYGTLATSYLYNASTLVDSFSQFNTVENIQARQVKDPKQAKDPYVAFGLKQGFIAGDLSKKGGYQLSKTATQRRREQRKKKSLPPSAPKRQSRLPAPEPVNHQGTVPATPTLAQFLPPELQVAATNLAAQKIESAPKMRSRAAAELRDAADLFG